MKGLHTTLQSWLGGDKRNSTDAPSAAEQNMLDPKLLDVFCELFGEKYRSQLTPSTSMDDIAEWDSLSYVEMLCALEEAFGITFTNDQAAQLFQLGHIQNMINRIAHRKPQEDVENALCLAYRLQQEQEGLQFVVMSGSSTREGLLLPDECEARLRAIAGPNAHWYNISVSGLVLAESLQLLEVMGPWKGILALGISPIIMLGCGNAEFTRSARHERFPFAAPEMERILTAHGYPSTVEATSLSSPSLDAWITTHLDGCDLSQLSYNPYLYPTLAPWPAEKYDSLTDLLTFYNSSILNHQESLRINTVLLEALVAWCREHQVELILHELSLHSRAKQQLEDLGGIMTTYRQFLPDFLERNQLRYVDVPALAGLADEDFRDPAHLFQNQEKYTQVLIEAILNQSPRIGQTL